LKENVSYTIKNISGQNIPLALTLRSGVVVEDVLRAGEVAVAITNMQVVHYFQQHEFWEHVTVERIVEKSKATWLKEGF